MRLLLLVGVLLLAGCAKPYQPPVKHSSVVAIYIDSTPTAQLGRVAFLQSLQRAFVDEQCLDKDTLLAIDSTNNYHEVVAPGKNLSAGWVRPDRVTKKLRELWFPADPSRQPPSPLVAKYAPSRSSNGLHYQQGGLYGIENWFMPYGNQGPEPARRRVLIVWGDPATDSPWLSPGKRFRAINEWPWDSAPEIHCYGPSLELHEFLKAAWKDTPQYCFHSPGETFVPGHYGWERQVRYGYIREKLKPTESPWWDCCGYYTRRQDGRGWEKADWGRRVRNILGGKEDGR